MSRRILAGAVVLMALGITGYGATAQEPTGTTVQKQDFPARAPVYGEVKAPDGTVPPPPHAQPQAPLGDLAKPAAVGPAQANTADNVDTPLPAGATDQTMPSTISEKNAALDKVPIGALQLPLSEDERRRIAENLVGVPDTRGTGGVSSLGVTSFLPNTVPLETFPPDLVRQIPETSRYKFVKREGTVFIIDPPNMTVVGEISL